MILPSVAWGLIGLLVGAVASAVAIQTCRNRSNWFFGFLFELGGYLVVMAVAGAICALVLWLILLATGNI